MNADTAVGEKWNRQFTGELLQEHEGGVITNSPSAFVTFCHYGVAAQLLRSLAFGQADALGNHLYA
jgi:hypothetical protein